MRMGVAVCISQVEPPEPIKELLCHELMVGLFIWQPSTTSIWSQSEIGSPMATTNLL